MAERDYAESYRRLLDAVDELGYPAELTDVLARQLRGPWSMDRMSSYLWRARPRSMEQIADELVAICDERDAFVSKKRAEKANAAVTWILNGGLDTGDED